MIEEEKCDFLPEPSIDLESNTTLSGQNILNQMNNQIYNGKKEIKQSFEQQLKQTQQHDFQYDLTINKKLKKFNQQNSNQDQKIVSYNNDKIIEEAFQQKQQIHPHSKQISREFESQIQSRKTENEAIKDQNNINKQESQLGSIKEDNTDCFNQNKLKLNKQYNQIENEGNIQEQINNFEKFITQFLNKVDFIKVHQQIKEYKFQIEQQKLDQMKEQFSKQKQQVLDELIKNKYHPCKILTSNEKEDLLIGYQELKQNIYYDILIQILYKPTQQEIQKDILVMKTLNFTYQNFEYPFYDAHIFIFSLQELIKIDQKLKSFYEVLESDLNFKQINSDLEFNLVEQSQNQEQKLNPVKISVEFLKEFFKKQEYYLCEYKNQESHGIMIEQVSKEKIYQDFCKFILNSIFKVPIRENQIPQNALTENNSKENQQKYVLDIINEYNYDEFQSDRKIKQNDKNQRIWNENIFKEANVNSTISQNFLNQQTQIVKILKNKNYFLCKCIKSNSKEDIFIGYQENKQGEYLDYVFIIKQNPTESEIDEYLIIQKFNEEINHFALSQNTQILILRRNVYISHCKLFHKLKQMADWSKEWFLKVNKKIINQFSCGKCQGCNDKKRCQIFNQILSELLKKKYHLCKYLNKGGFGCVFGGYKFSLLEYQEVVFKIIFNEDVEEEVDIMKLIEMHQNVVKFIDFIKINKNVNVIVLQKCKYSLLDDLKKMQTDRTFSKEKLIKMLIQLIEGLILLQMYNILHLDIKLGNILINSNGNYVFADFGLSIVKLKNQLTKIKGKTEYYASPEQSNDSDHIDFKSDIYSLGKTFEKIFQVFNRIHSDKNSEESKISKILEGIIYEHMIQQQSNKRKSCLELHKLILEEALKMNGFQLQLNTEYFYLLNPYDKNKNFPFFTEIIIKYYQNYLELFQQQKNSRLFNDQITMIQIIICKYQQRIGNYQESLEYSKQSLARRRQVLNKNDPKIVQSLLNVGISYTYLGDNQKALEYLFQSLEITKQIYQQSHILTAKTLHSIGICQSKLGNYKEALQYFQDSYKMNVEIFSENHPSVAISLNHIGVSYQNLGNNQQALNYYMQSLYLRQQIFQENHPDIADSLNDIGICYENLGDNKKALFYKLESLLMRKLIFKQNHPLIAQSINNVAISYENLGNYQKALYYKLESFKMRKQIYNQIHPEIADSLNNIGISYENLGDNKKALSYKLESLLMRKQIFKQYHPSIAQSINNVGISYTNLGNFQKALQYHLESLKMKKQIYNGIHPEIADSLNNIGICYENLGSNKKGLCFKLESLLMRKQIFKNNHHLIAQSLNNVGISYENLGHYLKAFRYKQESLKMRKQIYVDIHPDIADSLNNVAISYGNQGNYKMGLIFNLESLLMRKQIFKNNHHLIAQSLNNVGISYEQLGDNNKALQYKLKSLVMRKIIFKNSHELIAQSLNNVGISYENLGFKLKGLKYKLESLLVSKQAFKENHSVISQYLNNIAFSYQNLGDYQIALEYFQECLKLRKLNSKENHSEIASSIENVGISYKNLGKNQIALQYTLESLEMKKQINKLLLKENHLDIVLSLENVGFLYQELGAFEIALEYFLECLKIRKQILNKNHPIKASFLNIVQICIRNIKENAEQYTKEFKQLL